MSEVIKHRLRAVAENSVIRLDDGRLGVLLRHPSARLHEESCTVRIGQLDVSLPPTTEIVVVRTPTQLALDYLAANL